MNETISNKDNRIKPLSLVIDKEIWSRFKVVAAAKEKKLNEYVVELIEGVVKENSKEIEELRK